MGGHRGVRCEEGRVVEDGLPSAGDRDTGRRRKRRKGSTRASTSRRRSSGSPAQTLASIGTSAWWWSSEPAAPAPAPPPAAAPEGDLHLGNAGGAAVSSSSPRGLVLRIALGGRDGLVGRAARAGAAASMAGDTGARSGAGFEGKSRNLEGILKGSGA